MTDEHDPKKFRPVGKDGWPQERPTQDWTQRELEYLERADAEGSMVALLDAVALCHRRSLPLPSWVQRGVMQRLKADPKVQTQQRSNDRHMTRYETVVRLRNERNVKWEDVFEKASNELRGTPAKGKPGTIAESYQKIAGELNTLGGKPRQFHRRKP